MREEIFARKGDLSLVLGILYYILIDGREYLLLRIYAFFSLVLFQLSFEFSLHLCSKIKYTLLNEWSEKT